MTPSCKKFSFSLFSSTVARGFVACAALTLSLAGCGGSGDDNDPVVDSPPIFTTFQEASVVIGQEDFTSGDPNQNSGVGLNTLNKPWGAPFVTDGRLYVPDNGSCRILRFDSIPNINGTSANLVLGENNSEDSCLVPDVSDPAGAAMSSDGRLFVPDGFNDKVLIFDTDSAFPSNELTWGGETTCNPGKDFHGPNSIFIAAEKLIVSDGANNRVLVWNNVPVAGTETPSVIIGQASASTCGTEFLSISDGVWSDGKRLVVADSMHGRVLIWEEMPETNDDDQTPKVILSKVNNDGSNGSESMKPYGVFFTGGQLLVADPDNNRVLIWNGFPTTNDQLPDAVLGQSDLYHISANDSAESPSAKTLNWPSAIWFDAKRLFVTDTLNSRVLIFESP